MFMIHMFQVPDCWNPFDFVVHVGVSGQTDHIQLESCAHSSGYNRYYFEGVLNVGFQEMG